MIKQIKPNSLSHKFLSLIFKEYEIRRGINICDVPWRALKQLVIVIIVTVLSLWWTSFKEKTCFKIVVDKLELEDKLETEKEDLYEEEEPESCVAIYRKDGEKFVEVFRAAGYRIKYITSWLPHLLYDYLQEEQEIYLGVDDSEDKILVTKWVIHCLMFWHEDNPDADFSIAAYNEWKKALGEVDETTL